MTTTSVIVVTCLSLIAWARLIGLVCVQIGATLHLGRGIVEFIDEVVDLMDCYFARVILVKDLENLLVLGPVQIELVQLLKFAVVFFVLTDTRALRLDVSILIFIGH